MSSFTTWLKNSYTVKFAVVGALVLLLMIPTFMIESLISERQQHSNEVLQEISGKWGNAQTIAGPIINVPYKETVQSVNEKGQTVYSTRINTMHFLPEQLNINGKVNTTLKHRSIYDAVVYTSTLDISGNFSALAYGNLGIVPENILWENAYVSIYIPDLRGINQRISLKWNNDTLDMNPGIDDNDISVSSYYKNTAEIYRYDEPVSAPNSGNTSGLSVKIKVNPSNAIQFSLSLDINGSSSLYFIPIGKETNVSLSSPYQTPSFDGAFITDSNTVNEQGFKANWKVLNLNRNFPQEWTDNSYNINEAAFGVNFLIPVDHYQKSMRSVKYAIMFILLTFLVFLFTELLNGFKIHPVQYLLVGLALIIFYTLLVSLSEQIGFTKAYLVSSSAIILLITLYSKTIFNDNRLTATLAGILIILYGFLFIVLRSEDYALLLGSIGLFFVLCVIMYLSRKINWYGSETES